MKAREIDLRRRRHAEEKLASTEKALTEVAAYKNGLAVLLAAVLKFHHDGSVIVPESLVHEIEEQDKADKAPMLSCELKNGLVTICVQLETTH